MESKASFIRNDVRKFVSFICYEIFEESVIDSIPFLEKDDGSRVDFGCDEIGDKRLLDYLENNVDSIDDDFFNEMYNNAFVDWYEHKFDMEDSDYDELEESQDKFIEKHNAEDMKFRESASKWKILIK